LSQRTAARNCQVFLEKIVLGDRAIPVNTLEFKWAGTPMPYVSVTIGAGSMRKFDAIWFKHRDTAIPLFSVLTDSTQFLPRLEGYGDYALTFLVVSENCPPARGVFRLVYRRELPDIRLEAWPKSRDQGV
jgi:hypothetical protein